MGKVLVFVLMFLISLSFVSFVSADRYIVEADDYEVEGLKLKIVDEIDAVQVSSQVSSAKVGISGSKTFKQKFVVELNSEEISELEESGLIYEKDYEVKALQFESFGDGTPWNYVLIGLDLDDIVSDSEDRFADGVKIAILDTGVNHDLLDINSGFNFVSDNGNTNDDAGHGTMTAQILRRPGDNIPLKNAEIYAVKVLDETGTGSTSDVIEGILWSINNDMDIVLMSFGGEGESIFMRDVLDLAYANGVLPVAAVGNTGDSREFFPAGFNSVIGVGSINSNLEKSFFSSTSSVELVAPGEGLIFTDGEFIFPGLGTSFSVPHVGIVAAGIKGSGDFSNQEVRDKMKLNALDLGEDGKDDEFGYGLVKLNDNNIVDGNFEERLGLLESWKTLIEETLNEISLSLINLLNDVENIDARVVALENRNVSPDSSGNANFPNYFKYLSASDRKKMVCGYAEDERLTHIDDLDYSCDLEYKISRSGKESVRCKCVKI